LDFEKNIKKTLKNVRIVSQAT